MSFRSFVVTALATSITFAGVEAAVASTWCDRSIYQLLTDRYAQTDGDTTAQCPSGYQGFCNGTYQGIIKRLNYIQDMGFDSIWISPITQQVADQSRAYHGYTQTNLYGLNSHFGTADDLKQLSSELHSRKMYLMVDVVANHFGTPGVVNTKSDVNWSMIQPLNSGNYFHGVCWITDADYDSNDDNVRLCWLGNQNYPLPDVNTTQQHVRDVFNQWIKDIISDYSIDGIRIDTVKHVEMPFWTEFQSAAGVYAVGEVADNRPEIVCPYQSKGSSQILDGLLNYPIYNAATNFFKSTSATWGTFHDTINSVSSQCGDITLLGSFSENHDQARFANLNEDPSLAMNIITFTILTDGIPIMYAGQEQDYNGDANNDREATWLSGYNESAPLVKLVKSLNQIRRTAINAASAGSYSTYRANYFYYDDHSIGFRKGPDGSQIITAMSNVGSRTGQTQLDLGTAHGYSQGTVLVEVLSCETVTVGNAGDLKLALADGTPQVLYPSSKLGGTGVCGH